MAVTVDPAKADLHAEVDRLPVGPLSQGLHAMVEALEPWRARYLLHGLHEGDATLIKMALAPYADESLTPEELSGLAQAEEDVRAGRVVSHAEARRSLLGEAAGHR